ncbi:MAG: RagB/SusD family nutrient uptake outer membrane protein [Bacteroidota bacterium]|nr:RagB/SusD family nutrient uptake outer membrane protein [Bacteroidota bacterium]
MKFKHIILAGLMVVTAACSKDFLDSKPKGKLSDAVLNSPDGIEALCTAAYSALAGPEGDAQAFLSPTSNWVYGDVRAETAYKGGGGITDLWEFNAFETFTGVYASNGLLDRKWFNMYISVQRCNSAIRQLNSVTETEVPLKNVRLGEMKFLRAHYYFELSRLFNHIPYFDENVAISDYVNIPNNQYTRDQILGMIANEFSAAAKLLPVNQPEAGRVTKYAALAYEAKAMLYRAYKQNADNTVTSAPDQTLLTRVVTLCDSVALGGYDLLPDFQQLAEVEHEHGPESVFGIEYSINDGTTNGRINWSNLLNVPKGLAYSGDGFFQPSQNLVNSYKTDAKGIPLIDTYNASNLMTVQDGFDNPVDPRLDFTVGRIGIPWKDYKVIPYNETWAREPATYGYYGCKKFLVSPNSQYLVKGWPWGGSALNFQIIRYADVLLWKAEALIELGRQSEALPLINKVRLRAKNSNYVKAWQATTNAANYVIDTYQDGVNCTWTQAYARKALRFERKLELAMEGERFFDLVRWGAADQVLNNEYFAQEKSIRDFLKNAHFVKGRDEYFPIPQNQINFSGGLYKQNPGY